MALTFEILYKGQPAAVVPEYAEVELSLTNGGPARAENLQIWLGGLSLRQNISLPPGGSLLWNYNVGDLAGELTFGVGQVAPEISRVLQVQPRKLTLAELHRLRTERLPGLLARLHAPNAFRLRYAESENRSPLDFFSADFTAELLTFILTELLENNLLSAIFERLDYVTWDERKRESGFVPGKVRWQPTVQSWLNRPAEAGLAHEWDETRRTYLTLPNLLLVGWLRELSDELGKLVTLVQNGAPASSGLKNSRPRFENYAQTLDAGLERRLSLFRPLWEELAAAKNSLREQVAEIQKACEQAANPAYLHLFELWQLYLSRFVRLPDSAEDLARVGLPPTSRLYELWVACEIAAALGLQYATAPGLESAIFKNNAYTLYYNQAATGGWYSRQARRQPPRPDLRLVAPDGQEFLLDVKYRVAEHSNRANPDDMYRMLAYMNDLSVNTGGIIFPGASDQPALHLLEENQNGRQRLAEIILRPPAPEISFELWQAQLTALLQKFLGAS